MKESEKFLHPIMNKGKDRIDAFAFIYLCISSTNVDTAERYIQTVFAELEHDIICQRVKSGMENARAKGSIIGRPKTTEENIPAIFMKYYPKYIKKEMNISEMSRLCQMSRTTIYKYIKILEQQ